MVIGHPVFWLLLAAVLAPLLAQIPIGLKVPVVVLEGLEDEDPALLDDYLASEAIAFIEWPALAELALVGRRILAVRLAHAGGDRREVEMPAASTRK